MNDNDEQPTDQEPKIIDHPFTAALFKDSWPGICGHEVDGLPCGYGEAEHARLEGATEEVTPNETP
jgi:hypothetical protein